MKIVTFLLIKLTKKIASRGKSTRGWFYGFKLQGVCTKNGTLVKLCFRPGKEHETDDYAGTTSAFIKQKQNRKYLVSDEVEL